MLQFLLISALILSCDSGTGKNKTGQKETNSKAKWRFYLDENGKRMVLTTESNGGIQDCYAFGDMNLIKIILNVVPDVEVVKTNSKDTTSLTNYCTYAKYRKTIPGTSGEEVWVEFRIFSALFIYPGTKWCGAGNVSESYEDLGPEVEADVCCRDHDHCEDFIEGFGSKYDLDNNGPFTKSHCDCDEKFYQCLAEANTRTSNRIGKLFFNYIQMECFRNEHPIIGCNRYKGFFRPRCQEYLLDVEEEPIWQWFDAKHYEPRSGEKNEVRIKYGKDVFDYILSLPSDRCFNTESLKNEVFHCK